MAPVKSDKVCQYDSVEIKMFLSSASIKYCGGLGEKSRQRKERKSAVKWRKKGKLIIECINDDNLELTLLTSRQSNGPNKWRMSKKKMVRKRVRKEKVEI